jgi:hypothetical protein
MIATQLGDTTFFLPELRFRGMTPRPGIQIRMRREDVKALSAARAVTKRILTVAPAVEWCRVETWRGDIRMLRFHAPLIEPDGRISRIRLSEKVMSWPTGSGLCAR